MKTSRILDESLNVRRCSLSGLCDGRRCKDRVGALRVSFHHS